MLTLSSFMHPNQRVGELGGAQGVCRYLTGQEVYGPALSHCHFRHTHHIHTRHTHTQTLASHAAHTPTHTTVQLHTHTHTSHHCILLKQCHRLAWYLNICFIKNEMKLKYETSLFFKIEKKKHLKSLNIKQLP